MLTTRGGDDVEEEKTQGMVNITSTGSATVELRLETHPSVEY